MNNTNNAPDTRPKSANDASFTGELAQNKQLSDQVTGDAAIEAEIQAKGLTAPRVTPADIEGNIAYEAFFTAGEALRGSPEQEQHEIDVLGESFTPASLDLLTFCVLVLHNGFTVTGESACASPENFDAEIGRKIARANAVQKIWPLMGYALKERLARGEA